MINEQIDLDSLLNHIEWKVRKQCFKYISYKLYGHFFKNMVNQMDDQMDVMMATYIDEQLVDQLY